MSAASSSFVRRDGHEVTIVTDGRAGLTHARRAHPDRVLLDLRVPEQGGLAVLRELGADPRNEATPVCLVNDDDDDPRAEYLELGAVDLVSKPFEGPETLLRVFDRR